MELSLRAGVRAGDPDAFRMLFDESARAVYNLGFRLTANWSAGADVHEPGSGVRSERFTVDECSRASPSRIVRAATATSKPVAQLVGEASDVGAVQTRTSA